MTHGEIWLFDFGVPYGSLPSKLRPVVVMQNDLLGIKELNTAVVIPFTSNLDRANYEPNVLFTKDKTGLSRDSVAVIHLISAVNKFSFQRKISNYLKKIINFLLMQCKNLFLTKTNPLSQGFFPK